MGLKKTVGLAFHYNIEGLVLRWETVGKDLGVTFDDQLSFKN